MQELQQGLQTEGYKVSWEISGYENLDNIADWLPDSYGYCVIGFSLCLAWKKKGIENILSSFFNWRTLLNRVLYKKKEKSVVMFEEYISRTFIQTDEFVNLTTWAVVQMELAPPVFQSKSGWI